MTKVFINPGHGGKDGGATGNGLKEKDLTLAISKKIVSKLKADYNVTVKMFRSNDTFKSLNQITQEANKWKADIFVSVHINSGGGVGFESFIFNGSVSNKTKTNQNTIHSEILNSIKKYNISNRGKKTANFAVLRQTSMPAILTENLFIDSGNDASLLKNNKFINDVATGHVNGIVKAMGIKKKSNPKPTKDTYYRVVSGSYADKDNADKQVKALKDKGIESFIDVYKQ